MCSRFPTVSSEMRPEIKGLLTENFWGSRFVSADLHGDSGKFQAREKHRDGGDQQQMGREEHAEEYVDEKSSQRGNKSKKYHDRPRRGRRPHGDQAAEDRHHREGRGVAKPKRPGAIGKKRSQIRAGKCGIGAAESRSMNR